MSFSLELFVDGLRLTLLSAAAIAMALGFGRLATRVARSVVESDPRSARTRFELAAVFLFALALVEFAWIAFGGDPDAAAPAEDAHVASRLAALAMATLIVAAGLSTTPALLREAKGLPLATLHLGRAAFAAVLASSGLSITGYGLAVALAPPSSGSAITASWIALLAFNLTFLLWAWRARSSLLGGLERSSRVRLEQGPEPRSKARAMLEPYIASRSAERRASPDPRQRTGFVPHGA